MNTLTSAADNEDDGIGGDVGVSADGWLDREGGVHCAGSFWVGLVVCIRWRRLKQQCLDREPSTPQ